MLLATGRDRSILDRTEIMLRVSEKKKEFIRQNWKFLKHLKSNPVCRGLIKWKLVPRIGPFANTTHLLVLFLFVEPFNRKMFLLVRQNLKSFGHLVNERLVYYYMINWASTLYNRSVSIWLKRLFTRTYCAIYRLVQLWFFWQKNSHYSTCNLNLSHFIKINSPHFTTFYLILSHLTYCKKTPLLAYILLKKF